jgi:intein/homing endonuclease
VLLSSGEKIRIADINIGDEVISFHPKTMETSITKVTHHYIRETTKKIYNIKTISGREIIATEDHKFMTSSGWVEVKDLIPTITKIGIYMNNCYPIKNNSFGPVCCILSEEQFINFFKEQNFKMKLIMKYVSELKNQELLPLYNNNNKISILSRIFGFILSDGSINCYTRDNNKFTSCSLDFGTIKDYTDFQNDIKYCGFRNVAYYAGSRTFNNRTHQTFSVSHNGSLPALLLSLGITFGRKTETIRNPIPEWIMCGSLIIKREFLAGFQGGDGCKIRWNKLNKKGYNYVCASTTQQINPIYQEGLSNFINQCIQLMKEFNINVNYLEEPVVENRIKIGYNMSDSQDNLINYYDNIGYRYSYTKNSSSAKVIEYLKYKKTIFEKHTSLILNIRKLYDESNTNTHISSVLNVPCNFVSDTLRSYKNNRQISCPNLKENNIEQWLNEMVSVNETMFITIDSITEVENRLISDITVDSENHSFIAGNNFLSSNCAQGKQAMGVYATNYETRMDKTAYVLNYPARPLVDTRLMNLIQLNKIPSGTNVIVAIMTHTGYNQEDSILFNKGSIDRGLFVTTIYHTEKDEDKQKINGDEEIRCKPDISKTKGIKMGNYNKVNSKGVIPENTIVENRDIIIAKVTPIKENRNDHTKIVKFEDHSKIFKTTEETFIDKNYIDRNGEGYNFAKVRLRTFRKPVIGDKFSSRHGQKGTIGNIIPECDMPFTKNGLKPDIIINPHAIPSRMTIGQLKETILGKVLLELGLFGDGTPFGQLNVKDICDELLKLGYESNGNELLCNGLTGEQHECSVFMGPVFYQRLKHMVNDKTHSRSIGPMVNLTRQPAEGRSRDGGLRFGEMERDCGGFSTPISLNCGLSIKLGEMEDCGWEVLGWSEEHNGIVKASQTDFMYKGERECLEVTYEDGRKTQFTPDHPILTSNNQWVKIKDLLVNETRVKTSITNPLICIKDELKECDNWSFEVGNMLLQTDTREEYLKTLAFVRILGYILTDGSFSGVTNGCGTKYTCAIFMGHMLDVDKIVEDLKLFVEIKQKNFVCKNVFIVRVPSILVNNIVQIPGLITGKRVNQNALLPEFILDNRCPRPIIREFLAGLFGGDGHTCCLSQHRGKRDVLTSISFSQTKSFEQLESLTRMMDDIKMLLNKCGIHKITIQNFKETTYSKKQNIKLGENKTAGNHQLTLHLDIDELIPFSEKIGFRYCCHKSQRLEGGVSYKRLRNEVTIQHNWLVNRVDEITKFTEIKKENPTKIVPTKKAIIQAVNELKLTEGLLHEYAVPSTHDITDHLIKGTTFGKFTSKSFPTAEQYLESIGALSWFLKDEPKKIHLEDIDEEDYIPTTDEEENSKYGVNRSKLCLPTMNLKVISILPAGVHKVYDISVDKVHSFLANGVVAHNCMVSHGAARFTRGRLYDASDKYSVHVCKKCGLIASYNNELNIHLCKTCDNRTDFAYVEIPYSCKLLFQELITMNVAPRIITEH